MKKNMIVVSHVAGMRKVRSDIGMALGLERKQLIMVAVLLAGTFVAVLNMTLLTPALPTIMADMEASSTTVQWLNSGYALVEAVVIPLAAYLMGASPHAGST